MVSVNQSAANSSVTPPRRFILLPEESAAGASHAPRVRRYKLTSVGSGARPQRLRPGSAELSTAGMAREDRLGCV